MISSRLLHGIIFAALLGTASFVLFVLLMWVIALCHIGAWVFTLVAGGGATGG